MLAHIVCAEFKNMVCVAYINRKSTDLPVHAGCLVVHLSMFTVSLF